MQAVSRFEANLLQLLYFFLRQAPAESALPLLDAQPVPPPCLSRGAVRLVAAALSTGCVVWLAERGGYCVERCLRAGKPVEGRLWERTPPAQLGLTFSAETLAFLRWITAVQPSSPESQPWPDRFPRTEGDCLLHLLAHSNLRQLDHASSLVLTLPGFAANGLCRLLYCDDFAPHALSTAPDYAAWVTGVGSCLIESLQTDLAERWVEMECRKQRIADHRTMRELGSEQERVLSEFLAAAEAAARPDLARFVLVTAERLLSDRVAAAFWVGGLDRRGRRLSERAESYSTATAWLRQLVSLRGWHRRARATGYLDEGYAAAQWWLNCWERYQADLLLDRAETVLRQLDPLRAS